MLKSALAAMAAMSASAFDVASSYRNTYLDPIKYSPRAMRKSRAGAKLRRKAREGKLGIAVLR